RMHTRTQTLSRPALAVHLCLSELGCGLRGFWRVGRRRANEAPGDELGLGLVNLSRWTYCICALEVGQATCWFLRPLHIEGTGGRYVLTLRLKGGLTAVAASAVLPALLFGSVTTAHASNISRANAVRAAHEYLQTQAFSLKGLVSQLKFEGFSTSDATYGA